MNSNQGEFLVVPVVCKRELIWLCIARVLPTANAMVYLFLTYKASKKLTSDAPVSNPGPVVSNYQCIEPHFQSTSPSNPWGCSTAYPSMCSLIIPNALPCIFVPPNFGPQSCQIPYSFVPCHPNLIHYEMGVTSSKSARIPNYRKCEAKNLLKTSQSHHQITGIPMNIPPPPLDQCSSPALSNSSSDFFNNL